MADNVNVSGPFFRELAQRSIGRLIDDLAWEIGGQAEANVALFLDQSIKHPTPYYETQIVRERALHDVRIHDRGIVYGPWLEGTSSRNQTTRFKGYASFRRARQQTEREVSRLMDPVVDRWVRSMT